MKNARFLIALCALFIAPLANAQWQNTSYSLKGGWNAIYLHGDATWGPPATVFAAHPEVLEVWRWNPNPTQQQFTTSPLIPSEGTPDWSIWKADGSVTSLPLLTGQAAYLVRCSGTTSNSYSIVIPQAMLPPTTSWVSNGANLIGFPSKQTGGGYPLFSSYFATFQAAIAVNAPIYKYIGGDLGAGNPLQVFSPTSEQVDRTKAYWFGSQVVSNFIAPIDLSLSNASGLAFGTSGTLITVNLLNRGTAPVTITINPVASDTPPSGQPLITGMVPVTSHTFNASTNQWTDTPIVASYTVPLAPGVSTQLIFGVNRGDATMQAAPAGAFFASLLSFTDSSNLFDIRLPVTATRSSLSGLWVGDATVTNVECKAPGLTDGTHTATAQGMPLRYIFHVGDDGVVRLLSQVYAGLLAAPPNPQGLCTKQGGLQAATLSSAHRIVSPHMPLDRVILPASGAFSLGGTMRCTVAVPFDDPVNPFIHQYHPDHAPSATQVSLSIRTTAGNTAIDLLNGPSSIVHTGWTFLGGGGLFPDDATVTSVGQTFPLAIETTAGSTEVTLASGTTANLVTGWAFSGGGGLFPDTATISGITDATHFTLSASSTFSGTTTVNALRPVFGISAPASTSGTGTVIALRPINSYNITRSLAFAFAASAPAGVSATKYGSSVVAGTYTEVITGLHKQTITTSGTFVFNRVSEIGAITVVP